MVAKLFGTSGIRGKIGSEVTCELALNVGKSIAYYLDNKGTVLPRFSYLRCVST